MAMKSEAERWSSRAPNAPTFEFTTSRRFESWLSEIGGSLAFTTSQAGKPFFLGLDAKGCLALDGERRLLFANALFSCVAAVGERHSFVPVWQPP